jgi:TATA-box binding protein (TBP) (component of TFIID and TFIIIB)
VVTGARSESSALVAVQILYRLLRELHPDARLTGLAIQNIVASSAFEGSIDIEGMSRKLVVSSLYTPELFPGLRLKLSKPKMKALLFLKGRLVLTGGRTRQDIMDAWKIVRRRVSPFIVPDSEEFSHTFVTQNRAALRKIRLREDSSLAAVEDPINILREIEFN